MGLSPHMCPQELDGAMLCRPSVAQDIWYSLHAVVDHC